MGKLLTLLMSLVGAVCTATVIAAGILAFHYHQAWHVDRDRMRLALNVVRGTAPQPAAESTAANHESLSAEQVSFDQVLEQRALKTRNLELREQSLRVSRQQIQLEQRKLADEKNQLRRVQDEFHGEVTTLKQTAQSTGREQVRLTLETLKPKQAKELLAQMLEKNEADEVVLVLSAMTDSKRAKIISEFKTDPEKDQIGEVLRRLRQGVPAANVADTTQKKIEPPKGPGP